MVAHEAWLTADLARATCTRRRGHSLISRTSNPIIRFVSEISATEASKRFADLLDAVEHAARPSPSCAADAWSRRSRRRAAGPAPTSAASSPSTRLTTVGRRPPRLCAGLPARPRSTIRGTTDRRHRRPRRRSSAASTSPSRSFRTTPTSRSPRSRPRSCWSASNWPTAAPSGPQATVDAILAAFDVVAFDVDVARHHATLLAHARRSGRPRGAHDLQIAATARATGRVLVTTDGHAFDDLPAVQYRLVPRP